MRSMRAYLKLARIFVFSSIALFAITAGLMVYYTLNRVKNDTAYNKALIEQFGKPQIVEQRYISPMK